MHQLTKILAGLLAGWVMLTARFALAQLPGRYPVKDTGPDNTLGPQSDAEIWRAIRHGLEGLPSASALKGEEGVLVNAQGEWWSNIHSDQLLPYGGLVLLAVVAAIAIYFVLRGRIRIDGGRKGVPVSRFTLSQRIAHWFTASQFLLLALTGLLLMFGRWLLIPLVGHEAFSVVATAAMQAHNLFGPIFVFALMALAIAFVRGNFPGRSDLSWLLRGGGLFGGHASADRYNFGEKVWFWTAVTSGIALSVSGVLLLFPDALATRNQLQLANLVHAIAAIGFIAFALGHIYLGTIGTEGTLEGMVHGDVDENWARTHHDLWFERESTTVREKKA